MDVQYETQYNPETRKVEVWASYDGDAQLLREFDPTAEGRREWERELHLEQE